ncbi:2-polyprenyl-6-methoxyphenol hydroxylase [Paenimyroides ummariense]|uniref:2-polyprenyl-6-methoxyphenol hydroxylase n=1 Tax=Paenimyroides ummariense TaxID=913024 RepID=A0A1I4W2L0_9FLAO|nr:FAD-dependent monooxygenase [Paenimyroides ummariense]SFN07693.1 2-polyprenyl-6-methoxyphenol hydroxylase [Paenimyroides ummariense]
MKRIAIIGAGIGGLTTALAFKQKGFNVTVYESAAEIKPVGAGIGIANNAMQVFKKLNIHEKIENAGVKVSYMNITDHQLQSLSIIDLNEFEVKYGVCNISIHRAVLQNILAEEISFENIKLSKRLLKIEQNENVKLIFEDGSNETADVVIAADGIKSVVRNQLFDQSQIRDTNQICWRGVSKISLPKDYNNKAVEAWGKGKRFGFVQINNQDTYWYAVVNESLVIRHNDSLHDLFKGFNNDVLNIIENTSDDTVIKNRIIDLKPIYKWYNKNVCLLGDAAHATTPNLGQGACQAIEDAYALAQVYNPNKPIEAVFEEYQIVRIKKSHSIVNSSWRIGKISHFENILAIYFRNLVMRCIPTSANSKQLQSIFNMDYLDNMDI